MNHVPGNPAKWNFNSALPAGIGLSGKFSDVDVDEPLSRRTLCQRAKKVWKAIDTIVLNRQRAIESEVIAIRCLFSDRFVVAARAVLKAEVHARRRRDYSPPLLRLQKRCVSRALAGIVLPPCQ